MIIETILKINQKSIVNVIGNDIDNCKIEWLKNNTPISKEDIKKMIPIVEAEIEQEKQNAIDKRASGKQNLKDLGLDDEEIKALPGA